MLTQAQKRHFLQEGYIILESVIPDDHLELLRGECQTFIDKMHKRMDEAGTDTLGINHRNQRYFVSNCFREQPSLRALLFSDLMDQICQAPLGNDA